MEKIKKNVVIATSPFQLFLASKIIGETEIGTGYYLVYEGIVNKKTQFYIDKLSHMFAEIFIVQWDFFSLYRLFHMFKKNTITKILCSSIDTWPVQFYVQYHTQAVVETFDDGLANIDYTGHYYSPLKRSLKLNIRRCLLGLYTEKEQVINRSSRHYTIFPGYKNIVENTVPIQLFSSEGDYEPQETVRLLLGQPLFEQQEEQIKLINRVRHFDAELKYYYPHPKETVNYSVVEMIESDLLFEEYLLENSDKKFIVYTFFSTAAVNVKEFPNVEVRALFSELIPQQWHSAYSILEKFGIPIINIDEVNEGEQS